VGVLLGLTGAAAGEPEGLPRNPDIGLDPYILYVIISIYIYTHVHINVWIEGKSGVDNYVLCSSSRPCEMIKNSN